MTQDRNNRESRTPRHSRLSRACGNFKEFLREIQNVLKQENAVKVNTTLEGEYSIVKDDEEVLELKTFNTANKPILQTTDVTPWFIDNM